MSTHYFSPVVPGTNNGADSVNNPMGQLDAAIHARYLQLLSAFNALIVDAGATNAETIAARTRVPYAGTAPANVGDSIEYLGAGTINVMAAGATGDGVTDDSPKIQAAVDSVFEVVYFPPGDYVLETPIEVPANTTIICNNGVNILSSMPGPSADSAFIIGGSNVTMRGLHITGAGTGFDNGIFIDLDAGNLRNIRIENCEFHDLADAIQIKAIAVTGRTLYDTYIVDCRFEDIAFKCVDMIVSHGAGGEAYSLENIHIERNYFADCGEDSEKGGFVGGGSFGAIVYIGTQTSIKYFYLCDNMCFRVSPQFFALGGEAFPFSPREDFFVIGNLIDQEGAAIICNMCYTFNGIENLVFDDNRCHYVDYEHLYMRNCRNFKVSNSHFQIANIGISIEEKAAGERCFGEITNCTFLDCQAADQGEKDGNIGIYVNGDGTEINVSNCRFMRRDATANQFGLSINYFNTASGERAMYAAAYDTVAYSWISRGSSEYSLHSAAGGDPSVRKPVNVYESESALASGTLGALSASQWAWGDNNSLGYSTIYVQTSDGAAPTNLEITAGLPRWGINIVNCQFEKLNTGVATTSGGSVDYPGFANVINCYFRKVINAIDFRSAVGNAVAFCRFDTCTLDVKSRTDTQGLRARNNIHINTNMGNSTNPTGAAEAGAYCIDVPTGASDQRIFSITECTFRGVNNMLAMIDSGALAARLRSVIWRDNDIDALSTNAPSGLSAIFGITPAGNYIMQHTATPGSGNDYVQGDILLHKDPAVNEPSMYMFTGTTFAHGVATAGRPSYLIASGSPLNVVVPAYVGQWYQDSSSLHFWIATTTANTGWKQLTA